MKLKKLLKSGIALGLCLGLSACSGGGASSNTSGESSKAVESGDSKEAKDGASGKEIELKIPTYLAGENVGATFFLPQVERFNEKYAGKYKVVVEEVVQDSYAEKIKQLAGQNKLASKEVQVRISSLTNNRQQNEVKKLAFMKGCRDYIQNLPLKTLTNYIPLAELFKYAGVGEVPDLAKIFSLLDSSEAGCLKKVGEVIHFDDAAVDEVIEKRFLRSSQLRFSSGKLLYNSESVVFK